MIKGKLILPNKTCVKVEFSRPSVSIETFSMDDGLKTCYYPGKISDNPITIILAENTEFILESEIEYCILEGCEKNAKFKIYKPTMIDNKTLLYEYCQFLEN